MVQVASFLNKEQAYLCRGKVEIILQKTIFNILTVKFDILNMSQIYSYSIFEWRFHCCEIDDFALVNTPF